jgi:IMP cyclohydrolase
MTEAASRYVGRIIAAGRTATGSPVLAYRVSSRSFPNRDAVRSGESVRIVPREGSADAASDSPYIAYECLIWSDRYVVASNGTQTRPIFERLKAGNAVRDALASVLVGLDREFDALDTPRICGVLDRSDGALYLGSISADALAVLPMTVPPGQIAYISTYGGAMPCREQMDAAFSAQDAAATCQHLIGSSVFATFEKPVCATAFVHGGAEVDVAEFNS